MGNDKGVGLSPRKHARSVVNLYLLPLNLERSSWTEALDHNFHLRRATGLAYDRGATMVTQQPPYSRTCRQGPNGMAPTAQGESSNTAGGLLAFGRRHTGRILCPPWLAEAQQRPLDSLMCCWECLTSRPALRLGNQSSWRECRLGHPANKNLLPSSSFFGRTRIFRAACPSVSVEPANGHPVMATSLPRRSQDAPGTCDDGPATQLSLLPQSQAPLLRRQRL